MDLVKQYDRYVAKAQYEIMRGRPGVLGFWYRYARADEKIHETKTRSKNRDQLAKKQNP